MKVENNNEIIKNVPIAATAKSIKLNQEESRFVRFGRKIPGFGIILTVFSSCLFTISITTVKMTTSISGNQFLMIRTLVQLVVWSPIIGLWPRSQPTSFVQRFLPDNGERFLMVSRGFIVGSVVVLIYLSITLIPMSDLVTLRFTTCVWALSISRCLGKESCGIYKIFAIVLCLVGVVIIAHPDLVLEIIDCFMNNTSLTTTSAPKQTSIAIAIDHSNLLASAPNSANHTLVALQQMQQVTQPQSHFDTARLLGCFLTLSAAMANAVNMVMVRSCTQTPAHLLIFWSTLANVIFSTLIGVFTEGYALPQNRFDWIMIIINLCVTSTNNFVFLNTLKFESPGIVSIVRTIEIVGSFPVSEFLLGEPATLTSILGSALVLSGALLVFIKRIYTSGSLRSEKLASSPQARS